MRRMDEPAIDMARPISGHADSGARLKRDFLLAPRHCKSRQGSCWKKSGARRGVAVADSANRRPRPISRARLRRLVSVAIGFAAARPDEREALSVLVVEEIGVDRSVEARIVQLDREVVAILGGTLGPRCAYFGVMRCTALRRLCVARDYAESVAGSVGFPWLWR